VHSFYYSAAQRRSRSRREGQSSPSPPGDRSDPDVDRCRRAPPKDARALKGHRQGPADGAKTGRERDYLSGAATMRTSGPARARAPLSRAKAYKRSRRNIRTTRGAIFSACTRGDAAAVRPSYAAYSRPAILRSSSGASRHPGVAHYSSTLHAPPIRAAGRAGRAVTRGSRRCAASAAHASHIFTARRVDRVRGDHRRSSTVAQKNNDPRALHALDYMNVPLLQMLGRRRAQGAGRSAADQGHHAALHRSLRADGMPAATLSSAATGRRGRAPAEAGQLPRSPVAMTHLRRALARHGA